MPYLQPWLDFFNGNQGAITTISTVMLALTTMVYAWHTAVLARENRLLRKAGTEPEVAAYLLPIPWFTGGLEFVLANIGQGPALNLTFSIDGGDDFESHEVSLKDQTIPTPVLPQGERVQTFFGMGWQLFKEPRLQPFTVKVRYSNLKGVNRTRRFQIDVGQFEGRITVGDRPEGEMAEALKKIADELRGWRTSRLPVEIMTTAEHERRAAEARKRFEESLKNKS